MAGRLAAGAGAHGAFHARAVGLLERHARRRSRSRHRDRRGDDPALHGGARLRARDQSAGRGRPGRSAASRTASATRSSSAWSTTRTRSRSRRTSASICCRSRPTCRASISCTSRRRRRSIRSASRAPGEGGTIPAIAAIVGGGRERARAVRRDDSDEAPITPQRIVELLGEHALGARAMTAKGNSATEAHDGTKRFKGMARETVDNSEGWLSPAHERTACPPAAEALHSPFAPTAPFPSTGEG